MKSIIIAAASAACLAVTGANAVQEDSPEIAGAYAAGPFVVTLMNDGHFAVVLSENNVAVALGKYTAADGTLTLEDYAGDQSCNDTKAEYSYEVQEGDLALTLVDDACEGRVEAATSGPWTAVTIAE